MKSAQYVINDARMRAQNALLKNYFLRPKLPK